ncbi:hypothetical protein KFD70_14390 [Bacillus pfraonensis]|nr:hypothetical protein [Bacillus pseudomycoides]
MAVLGSIGGSLFIIAFILLILCIIAFFRRNGEAMNYGRPSVICFMISILSIATAADTTKHPIVNFFANLSFILCIFFLTLAILSVIKKTGVAKIQFIIAAVLFVAFEGLTSIAKPPHENTSAITAVKEEQQTIQQIQPTNVND